MNRLLLSLLLALVAAAPTTAPSANSTIDGYRGIWFTLGQHTAHGDKYSGGLATYTANHIPIAVYCPQVDKTFFVYGGTIKGERHLLIMASYYDHKTNTVPRPTLVYDKNGVNDPHDNACITVDDQGYLWVFISGRAKARPGFTFRSTKPYDVSSFQQLDKREMTYPQIHYVSGKGFFYLFTKYTAGRELYFQTSPDGRTWTPDHKLVGFGGHYQVSNHRPDGLIATSFMWHPGGNVDKRTNLYYLQTPDWGKTWTTIDGTPVTIPLADPHNPALLIDYQAQKENVYIHDLNFDAAGRPIILYLTSHGAAPGPENGPYTWHVTHYTGTAWETHTIATSDHNYDTGALHVTGDTWTVVGPIAPGPQPWGVGGEMLLLNSTDAGKTWSQPLAVTHDSPLNHSYARRPLNAKDPFYTYWADGNPNQLSECHLFFCDSTGTKVYELPYDMPADTDQPELVTHH